jgi:hypothetical protein
MAISHKDHDHPNTPAARAACRKQMAKGDVPLTGNPIPQTIAENLTGAIKGQKAVTWHVQPRKSKVPAALKNDKRPNSRIKNRADLADVPHALVHGIEEAWARGLDVRVGDRFRNDEARVVINAMMCEISLVWKVNNPHGVSAIWVRHNNSSKAFKVSSVAEAFTVSEDADLWDQFGNLLTA